MADGSNNVPEEFKFHPCDTPRGMMYYKLTELTEEQQTKLNGLKINIIRQNQIYLSEHPEIRVIISMILKAILRARPKVTLQEFLSKYFRTAWSEIKKDIDKCIGHRVQKVPSMKVGKPGSCVLKSLREIEEPEEEMPELATILDSSARLEINRKMCTSILYGIINDMASDVSLATDISPFASPTGYSGAKATPFNSEVTVDGRAKEEYEEYLGE